MGKTMTNDTILDIWGDVRILRVLVIILVGLLAFVSISTGLLRGSQATAEERLVRFDKLMGRYIGKDSFMFASLTINKGTTVEELGKMFLSFGSYPTARAVMSQYLTEVCEGR